MSKRTPTTSPAVTARDRFVDLTATIDAIKADPEQSAGARTVLAEIDAAQVAHALGLQMLRASFGLTQADVAANLGLSQANIAQTEHRQDLLVSTLRRYVKAITGGELRLIVTFPNRAPLEFDLGEVADPIDTGPAQQPASKAAARTKAASSASRPEGDESRGVSKRKNVGHAPSTKHAGKAPAASRTR
jgi:transcriptional regulator with XRE-family HTH domain